MPSNFLPDVHKRLSDDQVSEIIRICKECPLRTCDQQSLWCQYRLSIGQPNWQQKRKIRNDRKKARKRANETGRTKYWREYKRKVKADRILLALS